MEISGRVFFRSVSKVPGGAKDSIAIEPVSRLGGHSFEVYREAQKGARFDWDMGEWIASPDQAMRIARRLQDVGIEALFEKEARVAMRAASDAALRQFKDTVDCLEKTEAALAEKGRFLFDFQREDVLWSAARKHLLNANVPGTGKTLTTLCALPPASAGYGVVVACPAVAKGVWKREAEFARPDYDPIMLSGRGAFHFPLPGQLVAINYDILSDAEELANLAAGENLAPFILIIDEAHLAKNRRSARTKRLEALAAYADRIILLTGTPLPNKPEELWSLLCLARLAHEAYGSHKNFVRLFDGKPKVFEKDGVRKQYGYTWGTPLPEAGDVLRDVMVRHSKEDVLKDIPPKTFRTIEVELDDVAGALVDKEVEDVGGEEILRAKSIEDIPFDKYSKLRALLAKLKAKAAMEMVESYEEQEEPLVVFSYHRSVIDQIGKRPGWTTITGSVTNKGLDPERNKREQDFQAGKYIGVAATIQAAATALTLTRARNELFIDESWVPADNIQAQDRCHRIGTKGDVLVTRIVLGHPIDRHVSALIEKKMAINDKSVERARERKNVSLQTVLSLLPDLTERAPEKGMRGPKSTDERLAAETVISLAGFDRVGRLDVGKGFLLKDFAYGRKLAIEILAGQGLTEKTWALVVSYARKYAAMKRVPDPPQAMESSHV